MSTCLTMRNGKDTATLTDFDVLRKSGGGALWENGGGVAEWASKD
jgi:hypothetical protein